MNTPKYEPEIKNAFDKLIKTYPNAKKLIESLKIESDLLLFGGTVREYFDNGFEKKPRDIDLVLSNFKESDLTAIFKNTHNISYNLNKFGGYKVTIDSLVFDIWTIENTWAFKTEKVCYKEFIDLNKTVFLNIDAIFYNLNTEVLYDDGFSESQRTKQLDIVLEENPYPELNIMRAYVLKEKYNLNFSKRLQNYYNKWLNIHDNKHHASRILGNLELKRYGTKTASY